MKQMICTLATALALCCTTHSIAAWPAVEPMKWDGITVDNFTDNELDVPYLLEHFHIVANAVTEEGDNRGFLAIKVNREPKDNEPYNARIQENNLALAYFYATKRPWNPYYGSEAVRVRLEAMLEFWCKIQHPESGLFSEYTPSNFSLAPTGFGVAHISRTLELLTAGGPSIDPKILERTIAAQRKAVIALLTRDDVFEWTHSWSNQHTGVFRAALSLSKMRPDDKELRAAILSGARRAVQVSQSPAGFLYESAGPDIGYSSVHERFTAFAYHMIEKDPELMKILGPSEELWAKWLEYNLVPQPGEPLVFLANSSVNTRTSHSIQTPRLWPQAKHHKNWVAFQMTDDERAAQLKAQREQLRKEWPKFKPLTVPSAYAYQPTPLFLASTDISFWAPTRAERETALQALPSRAGTEFNRQAYDARRKWAFTYVNRPGYYAAFTSGKTQPRQTFGLGLLWNAKFGTVLQGVAASPWMCGTATPDGKSVAESKAVDASISIDGKSVSPATGWNDLPSGDVVASYTLDGGGEKTVAFAADAVRVDTRRSGEIIELLPLIIRDDDQLKIEAGGLRLSRGGDLFVIEFGSNVKATLGEKQAAGKELPGHSRVLCRLTSSDRLGYTLRFQTKK